MAQAKTIILDGAEYRITHVLLLRSLQPRTSHSLHLHCGNPMPNDPILRGEYDHLKALYEQCKAAGILCEQDSID